MEVSKVMALRDILQFLQDSECEFKLKTIEKRKNTVTATVEVAEEEAGFFLVYLCSQDYKGVDYTCSPLPDGCQVEVSFPISFFEFS
jgi:hypothetical protein